MSSYRLRVALAAALALIAAVVAIVLLGSGGQPSPRQPSHRPTVKRPPSRLRVALTMPSLNGHRPQLESRPQIVPRKRRPRRFGSAAAPVTGEVLSATTGTWTGNPTSYAYQWQDCDSAGANCIAIAAAVASTYTLVSSDIGHTIRVAVTARNTFGFSTQSSAQTGVVASSGGAAPTVTIAPAVTGTATQGQTLTTGNGSWSNSPTSFTYQWQDCDAEVACVNISGATSNTYTLAAAQVNHTVRAAITATNVSGSGSAFSNSTVGVAVNGTAGAAWNGTAEIGAAATVCNLYAATTGNDSTGTGAVGNPWATPSKLASSLTAGQVGCLQTGTYNVSTWTYSNSNTTVTAAPAANVIINGFPKITGNSIDLSYVNVALSVTIATSFCNGTIAEPIILDGNNDILEHDNIFDAGSVAAASRGSAIGIGWDDISPIAQETGAIVRDNRIHDYGCTGGAGNPNHGIYDEGQNDVMSGNWIYNDPSGSGIQIFDSHSSSRQPNHDQAFANVIDNTSDGPGFFLFEEGSPYQNNTTTNDVVTNTGGGYGGFASNDASSTNTFTNSDTFNLSGSAPCDSACGSVAVSGNLTQNPSYATANTGSNVPDFRSANASLASYGLWDGDNGTATAVIGTATIGATPVWQDANFKRANCYLAGASGTVNRVTVYLSPTGVSGTQKLKAAVYSNSSGPSALLAQSSELTFASTNSAGWYDLLLTAPLSVASGTTYCPALLTGTTTQVAAVGVASGGTLYYNSNLYTNPLSDPFGTPTTAAQTMSIFMVAS